MKVLKTIFTGVGLMILGAAFIFGLIALSFVALTHALNLSGWSFVFYFPFILVLAIVLGILVFAAIHVIVDDVMKYKARKAKKAQQPLTNTIE